MLDYKISGARILDGTGSDAVNGDVGIAGDRIVSIGDLSQIQAHQTIDGAGCYLTPGFIDTHTHSDANLLVEPSAPSKLFQGVTTEVVGNCGESAAPLLPGVPLSSEWRDLPLRADWDSVASYCRLLQSVQPAPNVVVLAGHGMLRAAVMGYAARPASADEQQAMERLLAESLAEGARGFSSGLIYAPGMFANTAELEGLARVAASHDAIYATHMRNEGARLLEAIEETLQIARRSGVRVQISHLKTAGEANWSKIEAALTAVRDARAEGLEVAADRYPYTASSTYLAVILPAWMHDGGAEYVLQRLADPSQRERLKDELAAGRLADGYSRIRIGFSTQTEWRGQWLDDLAERLNLDRCEAALHILETDGLRSGAFFYGMSEDNMWRVLAEPYVMLCSDAALQSPQGPLAANYPHPRAYGAFARFLRAALDGRTVPLPEAIRKMTSLPADQFCLKNRGRIVTGAAADLALWDPATLRDLSDYGAPHRLAEGMRAVWVNGVLTLAEKGLTGQRGGRLL